MIVNNPNSHTTDEHPTLPNSTSNSMGNSVSVELDTLAIKVNKGYERVEREQSVSVNQPVQSNVHVEHTGGGGGDKNMNKKRRDTSLLSTDEEEDDFDFDAPSPKTPDSTEIERALGSFVYKKRVRCVVCCLVAVDCWGVLVSLLFLSF